MLKLYGIKDDESLVELSNILSLTVNQEENVPADDLSVTLSYSELPDLCGILLKENDEILFTGIVDEQQNVVNQSGAYNRIVARSMAAVLLDNESESKSYFQPSTAVIFKYHIEPYGIKSYKGKNIPSKEVVSIPKGSTNWHAVEAFGKSAFGISPRVEQDGTVNFNGVKSDVEVVFSNSDGIAYNSIKENNKKCKTLSNVRVKVKPDGGYDMNIMNTDKRSRSVKRERFLDASMSSTSLDIARTMIDNSNILSYELELVSPERLLNILGARASVKDSLIGERRGLYVSSVYYKLTPDSEFTIVKLKKEN